MKLNFKWGLFYDENKNFDILFSKHVKPTLLVPPTASGTGPIKKLHKIKVS